MSAPELSSSIGVTGIVAPPAPMIDTAHRLADHVEHACPPAAAPGDARPRPSLRDVMNTFAPQSLTMYSTSGAVSFEEMHTQYSPDR